MKCPRCAGVELKFADRQGVEIDYCPECRGIWLDRGELDKIIERSYAPQQPAYAQPEPPPAYQPQYQQPNPHYYDKHHDEHEYGHHGGHHRRKSWLSELFD